MQTLVHYKDLGNANLGKQYFHFLTMRLIRSSRGAHLSSIAIVNAFL